MTNIDQTAVRQAIGGFLDERLNKPLESKYKKLEKHEDKKSELVADEANAENNTNEIIALNLKIKNLKADIENSKQELREKFPQKYNFNKWLENAANRMTGQLKFGTHISKGVHPDSKGDNINFTDVDNLPDGFVGSQTLPTLTLDANGNAAALPLAAFFNIPVGTEEIKLRDLIQSDHSALSGAFSNDPDKSDEYQKLFKVALLNTLTNPYTDERNKQMLWPLDRDSIISDKYMCLVPLHPSAFTHALYGRINDARYSETNKLARDNRKKKTTEQKPYVSISDLAFTILGGSNSQNVSKLIGEKRGRNYLLPSLPPRISQQAEFSISKQHRTIFNNSLRYHCYFGVQELFSVIEAPRNTVDVREQRKEALDKILVQILGIAASIQKCKQAGWSKDYQLDGAEKHWLDPGRADLEEEAFAEQRADGDWVNQIEHRFSLWLNRILKDKFKKQHHNFNDAEHLEWLKAMRAAIKASQRAGEEVFA